MMRKSSCVALGVCFIPSLAFADYSGPNAYVPFPATGATALRSPATRAADVRTPQDFGPSSCSGVPCAVGSGGDDSGPIQAAINVLAATYAGGTLSLPPTSSGFYNVCSSTINLPTGNGLLTISGSGGYNPQYSLITQGGSVVRILPGCATPPTSVFTESGALNGGQVVFKNFTIDGYCLAEDLVYNYGHGFRSENMVYRNSIGGAGKQNVYFGPNSSAMLWTGGWVQNQNDAAHSCYPNAAALPDYDVNFQGHDSVFNSTIFIGADISNYHQGDNSDVNLDNVHAWNYPAAAGLYSFESSGPMRLYHWTGDTFTTAAVHLTVGVGTNNSEIANSFLYTGNVFTPTTIGILIESGVVGASIHDNKLCEIAYTIGNSPANSVVQLGTPGTNTFVYNNECTSYATAYPSNPATLVVGGQGTNDWVTLQGYHSGVGAGVTANGTATSPLILQSGGLVELTSNGNTALEAYNPTPNSVDFWKAVGSVTGSPPTIYTAGSDTTVTGYFQAQGTGEAFSFRNDSGAIANLYGAATGTPNVISVGNASSGSPPYIQATGSDTNISLALKSTGTGSVNLSSNGGLAFAASNAGTSSVNYLQAAGAITGFAPSLKASGSDTNVGLNLVTQGTGAVQVNGTPLTALATTAPGVGVTTALTANVGAAGAVVVGGGALGTPSSGNGANLTSIAASALTGSVAKANGGTGGTTGLAAAGNLSVTYVLCQSGVASSAITGITSETNVAVCTVPAGAMGANGSLRITEDWTFTGTSGIKTLTTRFTAISGATSGYGFLGAASTSSNSAAECEFSIWNQNSQSAQWGRPSSACAFGFYSNAAVTGTLNTASVSYVDFNVTLASSSDSATLNAYRVELIPASGN